MPAKSKAQQRLMQAAEHGATFPMAEKVRASMTHQQMHDFAVGSEKGKPGHVPQGSRAARETSQSRGRALHPALAQRSQMVSEAHQHLMMAMPEYRNADTPTRMRLQQHHVNVRLGKVK